MPRVTIRGVDTYYEDIGTGDPLVLLHGGMSDGRAWGQIPGLLAENHRVLVPDRRGHGRTPDTEAPFDYADMAQETIAFCEQIVGESTPVVGWSDGANTSLLASRAHPGLISRQVLIGANFHHRGLIIDELGLGEGPDDDDLAMLRAIFESGTVDGSSTWPTFWSKTDALWRTQPTLSSDDLGQIDTPSLVMVGDDEPVKLSHTIELYTALGDADLCVIPAASHLLPLEEPQLVVDAIERFLATPRPPMTLDPIRRRVD